MLAALDPGERRELIRLFEKIIKSHPGGAKAY
jgi:hypothetical protein